MRTLITHRSPVRPSVRVATHRTVRPWLLRGTPPTTEADRDRIEARSCPFSHTPPASPHRSTCARACTRTVRALPGSVSPTLTAADTVALIVIRLARRTRQDQERTLHKLRSNRPLGLYRPPSLPPWPIIAHGFSTPPIGNQVNGGRNPSAIIPKLNVHLLPHAPRAPPSTHYHPPPPPLTHASTQPNPAWNSTPPATTPHPAGTT